MKGWLKHLTMAAIMMGAHPTFAQDNAGQGAGPDAAQEMMSACEADARGDVQSVLNACTWIIDRGDASATDLARAHNNRGNAYLANGRADRALADLGRAVELDPEFALAFNNRANAYLSIGRFEEAFAYFEEAVRLNPFDPNTYFSRGNAYLDYGDLEAARNNFDGAIRLDAENPRYHYNRGLANLYDAAYEDAIDDFNRTIELDPELGFAYTNRGNANLSLDRIDAALDDYSMAIEIDSGDAYALTNRGNLYRTLGREEDAMADYNMAVRVDPMFAYALSSRGEAHRAAERYVDAIADFRVAIRANPADAFAHNALAWIFATGPGGLRDGDRAVEHARQAVAIAPGADTLDTLAAALVEAGEPEEAMDHYRAVMDQDEANVRLYQKSLKEQGYYSGAVDGIVGRGTIRAFEACIAAGCQPMR